MIRKGRVAVAVPALLFVTVSPALGDASQRTGPPASGAANTAHTTSASSKISVGGAFDL
jgi:hypothetical protein